MNPPIAFPNKKARHTIVDFYRGFALIGLFLVHLADRFGLTAGPGINDKVSKIVHLCFAGKSFAILALCFGLSYHFLGEKSRRTGESMVWTGLWRYTLLFTIGVLSSFVFGGDVLQVIALLGFVLVFVDKIKDNRILLGLSAAFCLQLPMLLCVPIAALAPEFAAKYLVPNAHIILGAQKHVQDAYLNGNLPEVLWTNLTDGNAAKWWYMVSSGRLYRSFGLFLLGVVLGRVDFCANPMKYINDRKLVLMGIAAVAPVVVVLKYIFRDGVVDRETISPLTSMIKALSSGYFNMIATIFIVVALTWIYSKIKKEVILESAGKMTLTLYVMQSAVFVPLLYRFGLGLYRTFNTEQILIAGIVFFTLQLAFAYFWLKKFSYGPIEWLWRWAIRHRPFRTLNLKTSESQVEYLIREQKLPKRVKG